MGYCLLVFSVAPSCPGSVFRVPRASPVGRPGFQRVPGTPLDLRIYPGPPTRRRIDVFHNCSDRVPDEILSPPPPQKKKKIPYFFFFI